MSWPKDFPPDLAEWLDTEEPHEEMRREGERMDKFILAQFAKLTPAERAYIEEAPTEAEKAERVAAVLFSALFSSHKGTA